MNFAMIGGAIVDGVKKIPAIVWWIVIGIVFFKWVELSSLTRGKNEKAAEIKEKQAEVKVAVTERKSEIIEEERTHADAALDARGNGEHYPTAAELPDDLAGLGFRNRGGGPAS